MRGYFGVACYHPKTSQNVGSLYRTAATYEAAFTAVIGRRYKHQVSDTMHHELHTPLFEHASFDAFKASLPYGCRIVGVELSDRAVPLHEYRHPDRCVYLLGAEDHGLPPQVLAQCHEVVQIAAPRPMSVNVAVAGSHVIMDRFEKSLSRVRESVA